MKTETIVMCVFALLLGMLMANMLKDVCGCKTVEGLEKQEKQEELEKDLSLEDLSQEEELMEEYLSNKNLPKEELNNKLYLYILYNRGKITKEGYLDGLLDFGYINEETHENKLKTNIGYSQDWNDSCGLFSWCKDNAISEHGGGKLKCGADDVCVQAGCYANEGSTACTNDPPVLKGQTKSPPFYVLPFNCKVKIDERGMSDESRNGCFMFDENDEFIDHRFICDKEKLYPTASECQQDPDDPIPGVPPSR